MKKLASLFAWSFALLVALVIFNVVQYLVYWSPTEDVTFRGGSFEMSGTLIKPAEEGRFPAVIVLHGSGPESLSDPVYKAHANTLVRSGFAVFLYDKRGVGESGGNFDDALYSDFIEDASAASARQAPARLASTDLGSTRSRSAWCWAAVIVSPSSAMRPSAS